MAEASGSQCGSRLVFVENFQTHYPNDGPTRLAYHGSRAKLRSLRRFHYGQDLLERPSAGKQP